MSGGGRRMPPPNGKAGEASIADGDAVDGVGRVLAGVVARHKARSQELCALAGIEAKTKVETGVQGFGPVM
jgi:hypothetical protein